MAKNKDKEVVGKLGAALDRLGSSLEKKLGSNGAPANGKSVAPDFDPRPWMEKELKIRTKGEGLQPFKPRPAQEELGEIIYGLRAAHRPVRLAITKSRQLGCTTYIVSWLYALTSNIPNRSAQVVAHRRDSARKIHRINRRFYYSQDPQTRRPLEGGRPTKDGLQFGFPHDSEVNIATAGGEGIGRSETVHYSLYSEFAFWDNCEDVYDGLIHNVPHPGETWDTIIVIETTANGRKNLHYKMWTEAVAQRNEWTPVFLGWKLDPTAWLSLENRKVTWQERELEYQQDHHLTNEQLLWARYIRETQCRSSWERFNTEYPASASLAFAYSGYPWFSVTVLDEMLTQATPPVKRGQLRFPAVNSVRVEWSDEPYGDLMVWEDPVPGETYVIGVDVSEGVGADFTEMVVLASEPPRMVAHFRSNRVRPGAAGVAAYMLGCYYNFGLLCVERTGPGIASLEAIEHGTSEYTQISGGYPNLYYETTYDRRIVEQSSRMGWGQSRKNKDTILSALAEDFDNELLFIPSAQVLIQMQGFSYFPEKHNYGQTVVDDETDMAHDDSVMAMALANQMRRIAETDPFCPGIPIKRW